MKAGKLGKQFKKAHNAGVRWVVVCGPDDVDNNTVQLKDLHNSVQESVSRNALIGTLQGS